MGIRRKIFLLSLLLIASIGVACGLYLEAELRDRVSTRIEEELVRQALLVRESVQAAGHVHAGGFDRLADRLGLALDERVSIVGPDGRLLGDSTLTAEELAAAGNFLDYPDIAEAAERTAASDPANTDRQSADYATAQAGGSLNLTLPFAHTEGVGFVRVSRPLADVDQAAGRLRTLLLFAGILGLLLAAFMSAIASRMLSNKLRQMAERVRALVRLGEGGSPERLEVSGSDEVGRLAGSINQMADYLKSTVATLASERARFVAVLQDLPNAVIRLDDERRVHIMNRAALRLLGLGEPPVGEPLVGYLRAPAVLEMLDQLDGRGSAEFPLPGAERRLIMAHASEQPDDGGGCILVLHDVTDVRTLETVRQDFVANVSHELRTPVSIIRANAETLVDGAMSEPVHGERLVNAIHRNAERLSNIIGELLDLSRLEAGRYHMEIEDASVLSMAERAIDTVERAAQGKDIQLLCEISNDIVLPTDRRMCERILINYLDNAIKYTPTGGQVRVRAGVRAERMRLEVIDNGPGISEQHRKRIFERFYRIDPGRSRSMGGTGLGLSLVKHAGDLLGGEVGVEPVEPHGSLFWVTLPLTRPVGQTSANPVRRAV